MMTINGCEYEFKPLKWHKHKDSSYAYGVHPYDYTVNKKSDGDFCLMVANRDDYVYEITTIDKNFMCQAAAEMYAEHLDAERVLSQFFKKGVR